MRPLQGMVWCCALAAVAAGGPAHAAWNNVFQVCCASCGGAPVPAVAYASPVGDGCCAPPPCAPPCPPPPVCTTRYVQRCYYQPVTTYKTTTYLEPVTTYRTSYYYQPVTSYRYSCYYDPCTCGYRSVATPCTSYLLRSQCCPVTSYLQRTCCTPVTSYQQAFYYEPVTTCCTSTAGAAVAAPLPGATVVPPAGGTVAPPVAAPPGTIEQRTPAVPAPPPGTMETRDPMTPAGPAGLDRNPSPLPPTFMPRTAGEGYRPPQALPPAVRFDRIASREGHNLEGRVVTSGRLPQSGARVLFVSVEGKNIQQTATANEKGVFRAKLDQGGWLVYTYDNQGKPVFCKRVEVPADRTVNMTLVSR
jgi:hypothetical protein